MLGCNDRIHIVLTLDAVIEAGQQAVGIRREIHADNVCFLVSDMV